MIKGNTLHLQFQQRHTPGTRDAFTANSNIIIKPLADDFLTCFPAKNNRWSSGLMLNFSWTSFLKSPSKAVLDVGIVTDTPVSIILTCTYMTAEEGYEMESVNSSHVRGRTGKKNNTWRRQTELDVWKITGDWIKWWWRGYGNVKNGRRTRKRVEYDIDDNRMLDSLTWVVTILDDGFTTDVSGNRDRAASIRCLWPATPRLVTIRRQENGRTTGKTTKTSKCTHGRESSVGTSAVGGRSDEKYAGHDGETDTKRKANTDHSANNNWQYVFGGTGGDGGGGR